MFLYMNKSVCYTDIKGGEGMYKKFNWLLLLTALLPYLVLAATAMIFLSSDVPFFGDIMASVFKNNALYLIGALLICFAVATVLSVVHGVLAVRRQWDALSLAKTALVIKLFQIPAYLLIFAVGVLSLIVIFTIPFTIGLFLLDGFMLMLSGITVLAAVINAVRQGQMSIQKAIPFALLQIVFCVDVFAAFALHRSLKKAVAT